VQLRVKRAPAARLLELTKALRATLTVPVYVNDRADIALAGGAHGVHVGSDDLPPSAVRDLAGDTLRIGVSVGTDKEAARAVEERVDYWSIGSVYTTGTKPDAGPAIGPQGFQALARRAPAAMTTIAIGGITHANAAAVLDAGAHGVAVSSAVFGALDVTRAARDMRAVVDRFVT
jgi:thiamine-phosphate pyrophosphorylase